MSNNFVSRIVELTGERIRSMSMKVEQMEGGEFRWSEALTTREGAGAQAPRSAMNEWFAPFSAPKDGTPLIVLVLGAIENGVVSSHGTYLTYWGVIRDSEGWCDPDGGWALDGDIAGWIYAPRTPVPLKGLKE